ncbi:MAG: T9SS type A sorting domain-containing protein [Bacteroidia bacterium]
MSTNNLSIGSFRLYPNPTNGMLQIALPEGNQDWQIRFVDAGGRSLQVPTRVQGTIMHVDASALQSGTYFLYLQSPRENGVLPFIVQH